MTQAQSECCIGKHKTDLENVCMREREKAERTRDEENVCVYRHMSTGRARFLLSFTMV